MTTNYRSYGIKKTLGINKSYQVYHTV